MRNLMLFLDVHKLREANIMQNLDSLGTCKRFPTVLKFWV